MSTIFVNFLEHRKKKAKDVECLDHFPLLIEDFLTNKVALQNFFWPRIDSIHNTKD
jgi:hypothetical protein